MTQAPPTRRELQFVFDGTDEDLDLTELLADWHRAPLGLVETGFGGEDLCAVADLLDEFDAELAARETAETAAWPGADVLVLGNRFAAGALGQGENAVRLPSAASLADADTEGEVA